MMPISLEDQNSNIRYYRSPLKQITSRVEETVEMRVVNGDQQGRLDDQSTPDHQQGRLDGQSTPDSPIRHLRSEIVEENPQQNVGSMEWKQAIVGFSFDSKLGFRQVERHLRGKWKLKGSLRINADKEMFYLRFTSEEDRKQALEEEPMFINGRVFVLREWSPNVENEKRGCKSLPIWVIFRDLPLFLWNKEGFSYLASCIGDPLFGDSFTMEMKRLRYARLCVEVDSDFKFPDKLKMKSGRLEFEVEVEYQWIPPKCTNCECFGHHFNMCKEPKRNTTDTEIAEARVEENQGTEGNGDVQVHGNNEQNENRTDVLKIGLE